MKRKQIAFFAILLLLALLLAPIASRVVQELFLKTIQIFAWQIKSMMRTVPDIVFWLVSLTISGLIAFISILSIIQIRAPKDETKLPQKGPVQILAEDIGKTPKSAHFKWAIANRLAKLALRIYSPTYEEEGRSLRNFSNLDWSPPEEIIAYLEAGRESFMEFRRNKALYKQQETPFDLEIEQVVEFLETEMEQ
jgi:hypothetical protein